jgi:SNF2 family DNA or RNA helicase
MQMKSLADNVEMPQLRIEQAVCKMRPTEGDIYTAFLEEDELTASQKIQILRQFLLNPEFADATPGVESGKLQQAGEDLRATFQTRDKVVMFVNGYVEGVLRGDKTIFEALDLPTDVEVTVIDGSTPKTERLKIQSSFNGASGKMLLAVSGQAADVGVDFTGGEAVFFINEPWTKYEKLQQLSRVFRPGVAGDVVNSIRDAHPAAPID